MKFVFDFSLCVPKALCYMKASSLKSVNSKDGAQKNEFSLLMGSVNEYDYA